MFSYSLMPKCVLFVFVFFSFLFVFGFVFVFVIPLIFPPYYNSFPTRSPDFLKKWGEVKL